MSIGAMAWAVRQKLPAVQKIVLLMLADRHNSDTGQCNPSHDRLAEDCGLSRRSVVDQIQKLEEAGFIRILHRSKDNMKLPNQYALLMTGKPAADVQDVHIDVQQVHEGSAGRALGVVQVVHINQEVEPVIEPNTKKARTRAAPLAPPSDVDPQVWADWLQLRAGKRAAVTATVLDGARTEAAKAGMTLDAFLRVWCRRGSQGLEASWLKPAERQAHAPAVETPYQRSMREKYEQIGGGIAAKRPGSQPYTVDMETTNAITP